MFCRAICDIVQHWIAILNYLSGISLIKHFSRCFFSVRQHYIIRYIIEILCNNRLFPCTHNFALLNLHFSPQLVHNKVQKHEKARKERKCSCYEKTALSSRFRLYNAVFRMVGVLRFELKASASRTQRATNCAIPRKKTAADAAVWLRKKDSNPHNASQSRRCYHYTIPHCIHGVSPKCFIIIRRNSPDVNTFF